MASPNLTEIVTTTLRNRTGELADNVTRNNALLMYMKEKRFIKPFSGGRTILQELNYANNRTYTRYSGYELLNIAPSDTMTSAEYAIRQMAVAISISGLEQLQNAGKEQVIDLLEGRIQNADETLANGVASDMYSDGSLTGQIGGLAALVSATPASGIIGGIDSSLWPFWQNARFQGVADGGATVSAANIRDYMNRLAVQLMRGPDGPDLAITGNTWYSMFVASMESIQRIMDSRSPLTKSEFPFVSYMGAGKRMDVVLDGGFQGFTNDGNTFGSGGAGAVGGSPADRMWVLNSKYLHYRPHSARNCVPIGDDRVSVNQDAMVQLIGLAGNMTVSNRALQGILVA